MSGTDASAKAQAVLVVTCLSTLVVNANTSAVSILLPAISADTGMSVTTLQWAVTGYSLVGAATIVTSGSLGDVFGRKRIFQLGLLLFIASCVLIALSDSGGMVIAGRVHPGRLGCDDPGLRAQPAVGGAPAVRAQLRAVSLWGAAAAVGAAAGPLLGGVLVELTGWQGLFWVDAGVAAVCMAMTAATVTESRDPDRPRSIDVGGSLLVALTLTPVRARGEQGQRLGMDVRWPRSGAWRCPWSRDSRSSPWRSGSPSRCSTSPCCATGSWSAPRSRSSSAPAPSTR